MHTISKKLCAATLGLVMLFAVTTATANAQSFGGRMSNGKKAAVIGGSAVAGAVLGGLLGGKKGAVIGGVLGAGGGAGYVYYKGRDDYRYGRYYDDRYYRDYRYNGRFVSRDDWRFRNGYYWSPRFRR